MKSTSSSSHQILNRSQIHNKIMRLAYQIWEDHHEEEMIHVLGVSKAGAILANELCNALNSIRSNAKLSGVITLNKSNPLSRPITCSCNLSDMENQSVLCVDDVSNSGKTLFYALSVLHGTPVKTIRTAVLVERRHKRFPIHSDYVGLSLNTTIREHIEVECSAEEVQSVWLQ
ncbi:MAG: phosphoribosyltransferase family protein [Bacteroidota bacterium]|nr:phosphoribosyltransferase family protein [Bacteroidota bacterium]